MNVSKDLKWNDITSPTMTPEEFLNIYKEKIEKVYEMYEPKVDTLDKIKDVLKNKKGKLHIIALGADWCPDCSKNIPRIIKIVNYAKTQDIDLKILYGIMVNALHKPGETIWHKKCSPPEATDPKFNLKAIPTFYFFNEAGEYIGAIVENPRLNSTLEEDILEILEGKW
ncbi:MAG: thioredoxin family protein [Promethearchaeota archaeon]